MRGLPLLVALGVILVGAFGAQPRALAQQGSDAPGHATSAHENGRLGAQLQDFGEGAVRALGLPQAHALLVLFPVPDGPAERAGLRSGDVIVELEGTAIGPVAEFVATIQKLGAGRTIALGLLRGTQHVSLRVTLDRATDAGRDAADPNPSDRDRAISAFETLLLRFDRETFPEEWAKIQVALGTAYRARALGNKDDNIDKAISAYAAALTVFTPEGFQREAAETQKSLEGAQLARDVRKTLQFLEVAASVRADNVGEMIAALENALKLEREIRKWPPRGSTTREQARGGVLRMLGLAYFNRSQGNRAENIERTIAACEEGLRILTRDTSRQDWVGLEVLLADAYLNRTLGDRGENLEKALPAYAAALTVFTREGEPGDWAATQSNLGNAYLFRVHGNRANNIEMAIAAYQAALTVRTREAAPSEWAVAQNNLALGYQSRIRGDRADNLEKAIAGFEAVLAAITREAEPILWASAQSNLGLAYADRARGDRADNLEKAIGATEAALTVVTRGAAPRDWAKLQHNVAGAYYHRVKGNPADNLEKAIAAYEAALAVLLRAAPPNEWALTENNLANAYTARVRGDRADNLEKAIAHLEAALTARTRDAAPRDWAETQNNLAAAYFPRIRGDRADNLEKSIGALEAALTVLTRDAAPREWAAAKHILGFAYQGRIRGERADNLEKAIAAYEEALTVRTRDAVPREWAETQVNLGQSYIDRIHGDHADNIEKAIAVLEAVLSAGTRQSLPREWASAQHGLGMAYEKRIRGDRSANLAKAIVAAEAALTVRTRTTRPRDHFDTARLLAQALLEAGDWRRAGPAYASAQETFLLLFGQGLDDAEVRDLISDAGYLFEQAAFAAAARGDGQAALALASEGRARLMSVALKLQELALPDDKRRRFDELRAAVRDGQRAAEAAVGTERAAAIEKLDRLREELIGLVKGVGDAKTSPGGTPTALRTIVAAGGALVVPVVTHVGTKILVVTRNASARTPTQSDGPGGPTALPSPAPPAPLRPSISILHLHELTVGKLVEAVFKPYSPDGRMNWALAHSINYLEGDEQDRLWPRWLAAIDELGPVLWRLFGARVDAILKARGVKRGARLVWLPPGIVGTLPLGLAQDPVSKRRFADRYEIVYAPSLEALAAAQKQVAKRTPATLAAIVNPTGDLAGTEKEGRIVASHFPSASRMVLERKSATFDAVLAALKDKAYWHFASHGTFSWDDARQSALVLHGKVALTVGRLLEANGLGRPRLVVLSACDTGLYDIRNNPNEFIGLPGAFTALGAAGVVGTLWPVSDSATALLMAKFYELHMDAKLSPPRALWRAQLWLRQASNADLKVYASAAAKEGRLEARHIAEVEQELSEERLTRSRNAAAIQWIAPDAVRAADNGTSGEENRLARPYVHPYFWAGFIYTGL
jgi:CHAT domain-containing protein